ncbi:MAG: ribose-phosphate diphosphokinase [Patescibacteria group bacterium]
MQKIIFSLPAYRAFAEDFLKHKQFELGEYREQRFSDGTLFVSPNSDVRDKECIIIGGITPHEDLTEILLLAHTLKKEGARKIIAVFPYLGYARQDRDKPAESWGIKWLGEICAASGIDQVVTVDVHSPAAMDNFKIPLISLSAVETLAKELAPEFEKTTICIAPDEGAVEDCAQFCSYNTTNEISHFKKERQDTGVRLLDFYGEIADKVILVDDVLDTGGTLLLACSRLQEMGAKEIIIVVTHGLFSTPSWTKLWDVGVKRIYCTDSNPLINNASSSSLVIISIKDLIVKYFLIP